MKRLLVLSVLISIGALSMQVAGYQQPAAPAAKVVTVEKLKDNLFVLRGDNGGGNTAVFVTANGVVVVDAKNPGWGQPILDKIKELTPKPVTMVINTHTHGDHVSGNVEFPATVEVVTQENTKANMEKMPIFKEHNGRGLPKRAFKDKMTIGSGADQIDLYYFGPGHTNGDAIIVFPALRTAHTGTCSRPGGFRSSTATTAAAFSTTTRRSIKCMRGSGTSTPSSTGTCRRRRPGRTSRRLRSSTATFACGRRRD